MHAGYPRGFVLMNDELIPKCCNFRSAIGCLGVNATQNAAMEQKSAPEQSLLQKDAEGKIVQH